VNDPPRNLVEFVSALRQADVVCRPDDEDWSEHVNRISTPGRIAEVTEEDFDYWLDVLPPKWMRGGQFCFGEGADCFRLFWFDKKTERYLCRQFTWEETVLFCHLAGIPTPT
jgi:hypothetical protein